MHFDDWQMNLRETVMELASVWRETSERLPIFIRDPANLLDWRRFLTVGANDKLVAGLCGQVWFDKPGLKQMLLYRMHGSQELLRIMLPVATQVDLLPGGLFVYTTAAYADIERRCGFVDLETAQIKDEPDLLEFYRLSDPHVGFYHPCNLQPPDGSNPVGLVNYFQHVDGLTHQRVYEQDLHFFRHIDSGYEEVLNLRRSGPHASRIFLSPRRLVRAGSGWAEPDWGLEVYDLEAALAGRGFELIDSMALKISKHDHLCEDLAGIDAEHAYIYDSRTGMLKRVRIP